MSDQETARLLTRLDPNRPTSLQPSLRAELMLQRHPTSEDLEPGEIFDPSTQAYADPQWSPLVDWASPAPLSEDDLEEINRSDR